MAARRRVSQRPCWCTHNAHSAAKGSTWWGQRSSIDRLIWNIGETLEQLSSAWELQPGDLVFTGTPEGVGAVQRGDLLEGGIEGLGSLRVQID